MSADNDVLRAGIAALIKLQEGFAVAETGLHRIALLEDAQTWQHDVLLVELTVAGCLSGLLDARSHGAIPGISVVALVTEGLPDVDVLRKIVQQGIDGIVTVNDKGPQLSGALQAVLHGHRWLSPVLGGRLLDALVRQGPVPTCTGAGANGTGLSLRERHVLVLVAEGLTVAQIAKRLHRSDSAVKYHLSNMSARYQANNRAHLVYLAVQAGQLQIH